MLRVAVLSVHTCPLAPLGGWETGGMNVYVRELCRGLSRLGVMTDVFTRRQDPDVPNVVELVCESIRLVISPKRFKTKVGDGLRYVFEAN